MCFLFVFYYLLDVMTKHALVRNPISVAAFALDSSDLYSFFIVCLSACHAMNFFSTTSVSDNQQDHKYHPLIFRVVFSFPYVLLNQWGERLCLKDFGHLAS